MVNPLRWLRADMKARKAVQQLTVERSAIDIGDLWKRGLEHLAVRNSVTDPAVQVGAVYTALSILMSAMASVTYSLYQGDDRVDDHPFYDLMTQPNDALIGTQLIEGTVGWREMTGRAFWHLDGMAGAGTKYPRRIRLLESTKVKAVVRGGELSGWVYTPPGGAAVNLSVEEVIRFAYFDHRDPYGGLGPMEAARLGYSLAWKSSRMQELFYTNGGLPPFYVKYPAGATVSEPQKKQLREEFRDNYLSLGNTWKPPFMFGGAELASIAVNQRDAEWMATQKTTMLEILSIFGVPAEFAGYSENGLGAGGVSTEAKRRLWGFRVRGMGQHLESVIQAGFIDRFFSGLEFRFDWRAKFAEVMPEETRSAIETAQKLVNMGVPASEAFEYLDIQIDTKGKPWLEEGWLPFNLVKASSMMEEPEPEPDEEGTPPPPPKDDEEAPPDDAARSRNRAWPTSEKMRAALWQIRATSMEKAERRMLGDYRGFLAWLRARTIDGIGSRGMNPTGLPNIDILARDEARPILPLDDILHREAVERTKAAIQQAARSGWQLLVEEISGETVFDPNDPRVGQILTQRAQAIKGASDTIADRLRASLKEGLEAGETPSELAGRVRAVITEAYNGQAKVVARTETAAAFADARTEAMQAEGVESHEWLSARDERVRQSHQIDGEEVRIGDKFSNGLTRPHDPSGPPGETIQCRCDTLPVLR